MPLTQHQIKELKAQLKAQVQNLPLEKKSSALQQIEEMSPEALETLLHQQTNSKEKTIYRMIVNKKVDSVQIAENQEAIAVLEISPISKGHTLIIPKSPISNLKELPKKIFALTQELTDKLVSNLKASSVKAETEKKFGEVVLNLIPIYDKELSLTSPRTKASPQQLQEIKSSLETIKISSAPQKLKIETPKKQKTLKLNRRIP